MKTLITLALVLSACTKVIPPQPEPKKEAVQSIISQESIQLSEEIIKSNTWPVTASEWNDKQGCGHIIVFIRPYVIQVLNPTHQEYLDYPIGSSIKGSVLFEMLRKRGKI